MASCPEKSIACRVKALELSQSLDTHPPATLTYGGLGFSWDVLSQSGNIPIFQTWTFEAVPPEGVLSASSDLIFLHNAPTGLLVTGGIRINSPTPGSSGLKVQVYSGGDEMFAAPILLTGGTQLIPASSIIPGMESILAGEKLEVAVTDEPPGYGSWYGLSVDFMGFVDLNALTAGAAPFNLLAPIISGATTTGSLISSVVGSWSGNPVSFSYQWYVNGVAVSGEDGPYYTLRVEDAGLPVRLRVTALNEFGSTPAYSNFLTAYDPSSPPQNLTLPTITGSNVVAGVLTAHNGTWSGDPVSFSYQWLLDGSPISGATGSTYVVQPGDSGHEITVTVIASNLYGASSPVDAAPVTIAGSSQLVYWGRSTDGVLIESQVTSLSDSLLTANPAGGYPLSAGSGYWYLAIPVSLADPTAVLVTASMTPLSLAVSPDFPTYTGVVNTLSYMPLTIGGNPYYIFRSYNTLASAGGITITT